MNYASAFVHSLGQSILIHPLLTLMGIALVIIVIVASRAERQKERQKVIDDAEAAKKAQQAEDSLNQQKDHPVDITKRWDLISRKFVALRLEEDLLLVESDGLRLWITKNRQSVLEFLGANDTFQLRQVARDLVIETKPPEVKFDLSSLWPYLGNKFSFKVRSVTDTSLELEIYQFNRVHSRIWIDKSHELSSMNPGDEFSLEHREGKIVPMVKVLEPA